MLLRWSRGGTAAAVWAGTDTTAGRRVQIWCPRPV